MRFLCISAGRGSERRSRSSNASCALYNACYVIVFPQYSSLSLSLCQVCSPTCLPLLRQAVVTSLQLCSVFQHAVAKMLRKTLARLLYSSSGSNNSNNCSLKLRQLCALQQQWLKNNMNNLHMKRTHTQSHIPIKRQPQTFTPQIFDTSTICRVDNEPGMLIRPPSTAAGPKV